MVSQTFVNVGQKSALTVSLETGAYTTQQLVTDGMTTHNDIIEGTNVYLSIETNSGQQALAWQPTADTIFWVYGTGLADDTLFNVVRSLQISEA